MFDPLGFALGELRRDRQMAHDRLADCRSTRLARLATGHGSTAPWNSCRGSLKRRGLFYANVTKQLLAYALSRKTPGRVYEYEMPAVRQIVLDASADGYRWSSLIAGIAASGPFQAKEIVP
jgi:hypothetical protein